MPFRSELLLPEVLNKESSLFYSVGGANIEIINPSDNLARYVKDVFFPQLVEAEKGEKVKIETVETTLERNVIVDFLDHLTPEDFQFNNGFYWGKMPGGKFLTHPEYGFINFTFPKKDGVLHRFVGTGTHYAVSSFTKAHAFWQFRADHGEFMVSHSSSVVDRATGKGIVFSTADRGLESRRSFGKTTLALTAITRSPDRYAFASNDEVLLYPNQDSVSAFPLPNEISIMGSGLNQIFRDNRPELLDWHEKDRIRDDIRYYTTHGALFRSNHSVTSFDSISAWVFVSLQKDGISNQARPVSDDEAVSLFDDILFEDRMRLALSSNVHLGESAASLDPPELPHISTTEYFNRLRNQGVKFFQITGSVDPDEISKALVEIN